MANLFEQAKKKSTTKTTKSKKQGKVVEVKGLEDSILRYAEIQEQMSNLKAEESAIKGLLNETGRDEFVRLVEEENHEGTFDIVSGEGQFKFIPVDRYLKIDEERAEQLEEKYGDIVTSETKFTMNAKLIEKYGAIISQLIEDCDEIEEKDKAKLIGAETNYSVAKGTIKRLKNFGEDIHEVIEDINPVFQIKNAQKIEE